MFGRSNLMRSNAFGGDNRSRFFHPRRRQRVLDSQLDHVVIKGCSVVMCIDIETWIVLFEYPVDILYFEYGCHNPSWVPCRCRRACGLTSVQVYCDFLRYIHQNFVFLHPRPNNPKNKNTRCKWKEFLGRSIL